MRLITRNDATLVVGLIAGTIVVFQRPLRFIWDIAGDVQERYHVDLVPALTIFVGVFIFHESRKRLQAKADAIAAAAEAAQARTRSAELERLMTFSRALANALDETKLQQVLWRFLPAFAGEREFWVLTRKLDRWDALVRATTGTTCFWRRTNTACAMASPAVSTVPMVSRRWRWSCDGRDACGCRCRF